MDQLSVSEDVTFLGAALIFYGPAPPFDDDIRASEGFPTRNSFSRDATGDIRREGFSESYLDRCTEPSGRAAIEGHFKSLSIYGYIYNGHP